MVVRYPVLTSLFETLGTGTGVAKSMSASISEMLSLKPLEIVVSPFGDDVVSSDLERRFCSTTRATTRMIHKRTPTEPAIIKYK